MAGHTLKIQAVPACQRLTEDVGYPKHREHMSAVLMWMKYSPHWRVFIDRLDREFLQWGVNFLLPFPEDILRLIYRRRQTSLTAEMKEAAN
jgi:hypothetical protein